MEEYFVRKTLPFRRMEDFSILHVGGIPIYLNEGGSEIWASIDGRSTHDDIARTIASRHGLPPDLAEQLPAKVEGFLKALYSRRLLSKNVGGALKEYEPEKPQDASGTGAAQSAQPFDESEGSFRSVQSECMTPLMTKEVRSLSDRFEKLYWNNYYIHKMHLELTYRCNFRCVHCYNPTHGGGTLELTADEWDRAFEQLAGLGCYLLIFTGGELFVRKDAVQILQSACERGYTFRLNTNGSLIDEKMMEKLETMRPFLQGVDISFYGADPDVHDTLARRPGSYWSTLRAVRLLSEAGMNLVAKFVTMRDNFHGIDKFEGDMRELGVPHIVSTGTLIPRTNRDMSPLVQLTTSTQYERLLATHTDPDKKENPGACRPGHVRGAITPDGFVSPCEWLTDYKLGNVREQSMEEIWYGPGFQSFRKLFEQESECSSCDLHSGCTRCPAHSYLETGNLLQCAPTQRHYAQIHKDYYASRT